MSDLEILHTFNLLAGVDEVGRGPLAGPVVAAAVILDKEQPIAGLQDSKKISARKREIISIEIKKQARAWALGRAEVEEIDKINILQASLLAMQRAVKALSVVPDCVAVDGLHVPALDCETQAIVKGDSLVAEISAASILAKVERDAEMLEIDSLYPEYGFASHKGYPTKQHIESLKTYGLTPLHRRTFGPVARVLDGDNSLP